MSMVAGTRRQVLVQLTEELLSEIDELAARTGRNRSDLAREALDDLLRKFRAADNTRRDVEGYTRFPQADDEWDEQQFLDNADALDAEDGGW
jgi:metal-responsive CopG/Arc/MetJ family transcriptional regulator